MPFANCPVKGRIRALFAEFPATGAVMLELAMKPTSASTPSGLELLKAGILPLSRQILRLANAGTPRIRFLREVSKGLLEHAGCEGLEIWLSDVALDYRWIAHADGTGRFDFTRTCTPADVGEGKPRENDGVAEIAKHILAGATPVSSIHITSNGSWWTNRLSSAAGSAVAWIPLVVDEDTRGLLVLMAEPARLKFSPDAIAALEGMAQILGMAIATRRAQSALRERIKELTCLYRISHVIEQEDVPFEQRISRVVSLLPEAWQFPEIAAAQIMLDGRSNEAGDCSKLFYRQQADIVVGGTRRGFVEVGYTESYEDFAEGPFLPEEQKLIGAVARELALCVERHETYVERCRMEEQIRHADRLATLGQFAAGVAHEINEPLGGILGFAQLIQKSGEISPQSAADVEQIIAASLRAREIVRKIMLFARQTYPEKRAIELSAAVDDAVLFLEPRCAKQGIKLERRLAEPSPVILADPVQINQVVVNLVVNALQATSGAGRIVVQTKDLGGAAQIIVSDTGCGIKPEIMDRIFNPFFTTKEIGVGTGLGLSVVHGIVTSHGGTIDVTSEPGHGATFTVNLPTAAESTGKGV